MEHDLISRETLKKAVRESYHNNPHPLSRDKAMHRHEHNHMIALIEAAPAVEIEKLRFLLKENGELIPLNRRWIPVTEDLPKLIPCGAGTAYSEAVNVLTTGRKVLTAIWDGTDFIADAEFWEAEGEEITHWTPVLLPLPEPPKGE